MYNYASKILSAVSDPVAIVLLLAILALLGWRNRGRSLALLLALLIVLGALSSPPVADALLRTLEDQYRDVGLETVEPAGAIVLLGGTLRIASGEHAANALGDGSDRLLVAFRLYRAGKAPLVVCAGGNNPLSGLPGERTESAAMCGILREWGIPSEALLEEPRSINTRGNAVESHALLAARGIERIVLVTSAVHMPRSVAAFRKVGFAVVPAPADYRTRWAPMHPVLRWVPTPIALLYSSFALHEWIGLVTYRLRGWA